MNLVSLVSSVQRFEGFKEYPYECPNGFLTIGYGFNLESGISKKDAKMLLESRLLDIKLELEDKLSFFSFLSDSRQNVLIEMAYNIGVAGLLKFKKTLKFIELGDYEKASAEMLDSKWHRDFISLAPGTKIEELRSSKLSQQFLKG